MTFKTANCERLFVTLYFKRKEQKSKVMRRYYCITFLALIVVVLLQGYNISLRYKNYIHNEIDKVNSVLKVAIDEEYASRVHKVYNPHKDGKQRFYYKNVNLRDVIKAKPKKEDIIDFNEINIQDLRNKGIAETEGEVMSLLTKDRLTIKGHPINLVKLSQFFTKNLGENFSFAFFILDENKKTVKSYGQTNGTANWQSSKPIAIGLKPVRFVKVMIDIPPSAFIKSAIETLISTLLLALIIIFCVGYQMTVIRHKEDLLRNRETGIHGTIHDLKAPLASVLLTLGYITEEIKDSELRELITSAEEEIKSLANTIKTILITAKAGESKLIINKEEFDIMAAANHAKKIIDTNYVQIPHTINIIDHRAKNEKILADRYLLENVVHNLMENAVKYSGNTATVDVDIYNNERFTIISVKDKGVGIDKKYQKKIFEQFYRIPATHHKSGYGIGLALVKYAVKAHGGSIKVESEPGKGSTFIFMIPQNKNIKE